MADGEIEHATLSGHDLNETVLFHRRSGTLVNPGVAAAMPARGPWITRGYGDASPASVSSSVSGVFGVAVAVLEALGTAVSYDEQRFTDWRFRTSNDMPTLTEWIICHLASLRVSLSLYWLAPLGIVFAVYVNT